MILTVKIMKGNYINSLINIMKKHFSILALMFFLSIISCKVDSKEEKITQKLEVPEISFNQSNLNISVLMDLSDRINPEKFPSPAMEYYLRDVGYLKSIAKNFEAHVLNKKMVLIDDKIQAFIDPEPSDSTINDKLKELKIAFDKKNVTKEGILLINKKYESISKNIYERAIKDNQYVGSDTWRFFKNKVNSYCIEKGYRNILVILTDGYIYHKNTIIKDANRTTYLTPQDIRKFGLNKLHWKEKFNQKDFGFVTIETDLSNLEVLVLGINPDVKSPFEEDVINAYWSKWLKEMKVENFEIKQADLPSHMEKIISDFILD